MGPMIDALRQFVSEEEGVDALEYGILAALIFLVILGSVAAVASNTTSMYSTLSASMGPAPAP
jgi:pilus assembly protein Flp/PilA